MEHHLDFLYRYTIENSEGINENHIHNHRYITSSNGNEREDSFVFINVIESNWKKTFIIHRDKLMRCSPALKEVLDCDMYKETGHIFDIKDMEISTFEILEKYINGKYVTRRIAAPHFSLQLDPLLALIEAAERYRIVDAYEDCTSHAIKKYMENSSDQPTMVDMIKILKFAHKNQFNPFLDYFVLPRNASAPTVDPQCQNPFNNRTIFGPYKWTFEDITELYHVAKDLKLEKITNNITDYIITEPDIINVRNCTSILPKLSIFPGSIMQREVKRSCLKVLQENAETLLQSESLLLVHLDLFLDIIDLENLRINSELVLINFVQRWFYKFAEIEIPNKPVSSTVKDIFENNEKLRKEILSKFRLLTLSFTDFSSNSFLMSLLSVEETEIITEAIKNLNVAKFPSYLSTSTTRR